MALQSTTQAIVSIEPIGPQVYAVAMDRPHPACLPETHTVHLRALAWNGSCTCRAFTECCAFLLKNDGRHRHRCDHILAARQYFMEHEAPRMIAEFENSKIIVLPEYENRLADSGQ